MALRSGETHKIEDDAERQLAADRKTRPQTHDERTFYYSREQMMHRQSHEIFNVNGVPDSALMRGMFKKAHNPEAGGRPRSIRQEDQ